ncbi:MAG: hypothetical protein LH471_02240, partial [Salinibacterium sp.]|nr:hypothetical protein [Salinibacterium sp.]
QATDLAHGKRIQLDAAAVTAAPVTKAPSTAAPSTAAPSTGLPSNPAKPNTAKPNTATPIAVIDPAERLVGLVEIIDGRARVLVNFPTDGLLA